jgi:hypothetical protein
LEEQRKEELKKRIELEESMRKNAGVLMDLTYKKCEFLVDGMKNAVEMGQMKDKLEGKQAMELLKD